MGENNQRRSKIKRKENHIMQVGIKLKLKLNNTIRYKTRLWEKGFHQVKGVDYTESFSPVENTSTINIMLQLALYWESKGWTCKMFDVEAAFLNAELETPMYLERPDFMKELGFITKREESEQWIQLVRSIHRNVDAALRWQRSFIKLCTNEEIGCIQSQADPCMLYKRDDTGQLQLIVAVQVDDV